jgi:hypothetical protein
MRPNLVDAVLIPANQVSKCQIYCQVTQSDKWLDVGADRSLLPS